MPFFDGYVHKHTSFKEFVDKNDLSLHQKHLKEAMADLETKDSSFELKTRLTYIVKEVPSRYILPRWGKDFKRHSSCGRWKTLHCRNWKSWQTNSIL
ncbi:hypothetical protein NC651_038111 [Populus alba x Populus x berolinensis]|nr:hypothetical protein NC651_038111 [Populus alba x Populus x berolinensis]